MAYGMISLSDNGYPDAGECMILIPHPNQICLGKFGLPLSMHGEGSNTLGLLLQDDVLMLLRLSDNGYTDASECMILMPHPNQICLGKFDFPLFIHGEEDNTLGVILREKVLVIGTI